MVAVAIVVHAPVPVGHRVEIRWFEVPGGLFGNKLEVREAEPLVIDLDTGIEYAPRWLYTEETGVRPGTPCALGATPLPHLRVAKVLTGVVHRCLISTHVGGSGTSSLQTDLEIE